MVLLFGIVIGVLLFVSVSFILGDDGFGSEYDSEGDFNKVLENSTLRSDGDYETSGLTSFKNGDDVLVLIQEYSYSYPIDARVRLTYLAEEKIFTVYFDAIDQNKNIELKLRSAYYSSIPSEYKDLYIPNKEYQYGLDYGTTFEHDYDNLEEYFSEFGAKEMEYLYDAIKDAKEE